MKASLTREDLELITYRLCKAQKAFDYHEFEEPPKDYMDKERDHFWLSDRYGRVRESEYIDFLNSFQRDQWECLGRGSHQHL